VEGEVHRSRKPQRLFTMHCCIHSDLSCAMSEESGVAILSPINRHISWILQSWTAPFLLRIFSRVVSWHPFTEHLNTQVRIECVFKGVIRYRRLPVMVANCPPRHDLGTSISQLTAHSDRHRGPVDHSAIAYHRGFPASQEKPRGLSP